ncbi:hypothetical protein ACJX0J_028652, partial [Zea mays]
RLLLQKLLCLATRAEMMHHHLNPALIQNVNYGATFIINFSHLNLDLLATQIILLGCMFVLFYVTFLGLH